MVPKVECIYYLDGVWRVWMQYDDDDELEESLQPSTFWQRKIVQMIKWSKGYCLLYVHVILKHKPSHWDGFIFVSLQITVLFVYVVFLPLVAIVWLLPVTVFVLLTEIVNVM